jgi:hypothetical protein
VKEWDPSARPDTDTDTTPLFSVPVAITVDPSLNVIGPAADAGDTKAVRVTLWPHTEGFVADVRVVLVVTGLFTRLSGVKPVGTY